MIQMGGSVVVAMGISASMPGLLGFGVDARVGWWVGSIDMLLLVYFLVSHAGPVLTLLLDALQWFMNA